MSRSVTFTIAYLMRHFSLPMQAAYQYVKERRPASSPNLNFMGQLVAFENGGVGGALQLEDYRPSLAQDWSTTLVQRRRRPWRRKRGSSRENTPEASDDESW